MFAFAPVYFILSLIELTVKLANAPAWFDGTLNRNHALLLAMRYTNNEQSRLLQYLIPQALVRSFGLSVEHAYLVQRWVFVWLAFCLFHLYQRKWFSKALAFGGVCFLAAVMTLSFARADALQESAPLLMVMFLLGLWTIREKRWILFTLVLVVGTLDNETMLCLPALVFFAAFRGMRWRELMPVVRLTLLTALPAYLIEGIIRFITRHRPQLGGAWHLPLNVGSIVTELFWSPLNYFHAMFLYPVFIFGMFWIYACLGLGRKPVFVRRSMLLVPLFILPNLLTGIVGEVREMIPLAFIIIPAASFWLFGDEPASIQPMSTLPPR